MTIELAPSISPQTSHAGRRREARSTAADRDSLDVMDGHFVPNLTIGPLVVKSCGGPSNAILDCH